MQYAIDKHSHLEILVDLQAPYVIIPYSGKYTGSEKCLIANLGSLKISTVEKKSSVLDVKKMHAQGIEEKEILKELIEQSYDKFVLQFTKLQVILAQSSEDWYTVIQNAVESPLHLLYPVSLEITFYKCLINDDPRLPLNKIMGELPSLALNLTDAQLMDLLSLVKSIPFPESEPTELKPLTVSCF